MSVVAGSDKMMKNRKKFTICLDRLLDKDSMLDKLGTVTIINLTINRIYSKVRYSMVSCEGS